MKHLLANPILKIGFIKFVPTAVLHTTQTQSYLKVFTDAESKISKSYKLKRQFPNNNTSLMKM